MNTMKKLNHIFFGLAMGAALVGVTTSCDDFEEINVDPSVAGVEVVKPYYALNAAIVNAQQDPHIHERIFVYNWASAARVSGDMGYLNLGRYSDSFNHDYLNSYITDWIKRASLAIDLVDEQSGSLTSDHDIAFNKNVKSFARIWRACLIAEFVNNFGPYPLDAFQGETPTFSNEKDCFYFILSELKEAAGQIDTSVEPTGTEAKSDPAYGYNAAKWQKFGNTLRMRYAMQLSVVDPSKAQSEFEDAARGPIITTLDDMFKVKEFDQWNAWAPVYSRSWNYVALSSTMSNLLVGLGGIPVAEQRPDLAEYTKDMDYLGMKFDQHYAENTDNPTKQFWMDGIPANIDPRGLKVWMIPNDTQAENFMDKGSVKDHASYAMMDKDGNEQVKIDAQFTWNYYPVGQRSAWSDKFAKNKVVSNYDGTLVLLGKQYRDASGSRIWVAPWETQFLLAEAALYGWNVGVSAQAAYEAGVKVSFEHHGVSQFADAYLNSEDYNRVGTSVKFTHTTEPKSMTVNYVDGYTNEAKTMTYQYPDANKILYKGKKLNDQLTKIITQKYIAQTPYGALEMWTDHRRLGLPFFDIPANEAIFTGADMENTWTPTTYQTGQKITVYPQRLRYPTSLKNADPNGYATAIQLLGGEDVTISPLWWAQH